MLVYDVNVMKSFENLNNWREEFLLQVIINLSITKVVYLQLKTMNVNLLLDYFFRPVHLILKTFHLLFWGTR